MQTRGVSRNKHSPEVFVDENKSVDSLKVFFPEFFDCMDFYARHRALTFSPRNAPQHCEVCKQPATGLYCFTWYGVGSKQESDATTLALAVASRLAGGHRMNSRWVEHKVHYDTHHTFCDACWKTHRAQMQVLKQCLWISFAGAYFICLIIVFIIGTHLPQDNSTNYWIAMAIGAILAGVVAWGIAKGVRAFVRMFTGCPKNLRVLGGNYFVLLNSAPAE